MLAHSATVPVPNCSPVTVLFCLSFLCAPVNIWEACGIPLSGGHGFQLYAFEKSTASFPPYFCLFVCFLSLPLLNPVLLNWWWFIVNASPKIGFTFPQSAKILTAEQAGQQCSPVLLTAVPKRSTQIGWSPKQWQTLHYSTKKAEL